ncbi:MAG: hypothetical protein IPQ07_40385 [Myxococcales bacterium]|nr:hypothetical protein [Myxococcales bacterium]
MSRRLASLLLLAACSADQHGECRGDLIAPASTHECIVPNWFDRAFELDVPGSWDGRSPLPVVVLLTAAVAVARRLRTSRRAGR